jgi:hypothetical protein
VPNTDNAASGTDNAAPSTDNAVSISGRSHYPLIMLHYAEGEKCTNNYRGESCNIAENAAQPKASAGQSTGI